MRRARVRIDPPRSAYQSYVTACYTPPRREGTMTRAGWLVSAMLVASAAPAEEEGTAQAEDSDDQAEVPEVALPGSTGTVAAGKGSGAAGRIEVARPGGRG